MKIQPISKNSFTNEEFAKTKNNIIEVSQEQYDKLICGEMVFNDSLTNVIINKDYEKQIQEQYVNDLRQQRENECFSIINRGNLWYNKLTQQQINELESWYRDWLNATNTNIIPKKPTWLK